MTIRSYRFDEPAAVVGDIHGRLDLLEELLEVGGEKSWVIHAGVPRITDLPPSPLEEVVPWIHPWPCSGSPDQGPWWTGR